MHGSARLYGVMGDTAWEIWMAEPGEATGGRATTERAFGRLAERELASAYRTALLLLGDSGDAEDAVQDALVRAWQRWGQLREPDHARAWFGRILVNICRDQLRSSRHPVRWIDDAPIPDAASAAAERDALGRAMRGMNADQRIALVLRYYLDLPVEEIAERTGAPAATVRSRIRLALDAVRAAYEAQERGGGRR
jgi:RNA polymerase sigma-70 factor (ECF subfamily)